MLEEKTGGNGFIIVKDVETGHTLECGVRFVAVYRMTVTDESKYLSVTASEPIKKIMKNLMDDSFTRCFATMYPDGSEYDQLARNLSAIGEAMKEAMQPELSDKGICVECVQILSINIPEEYQKQLDEMQLAHKSEYKFPTPKNPYTDNIVVPAYTGSEWVCTCGNKNNSRFCTKCGKKKDGLS